MMQDQKAVAVQEVVNQLPSFLFLMIKTIMI